MQTKSFLAFSSHSILLRVKKTWNRSIQKNGESEWDYLSQELLNLSISIYVYILNEKLWLHSFYTFVHFALEQKKFFGIKSTLMRSTPSLREKPYTHSTNDAVARHHPFHKLSFAIVLLCGHSYTKLNTIFSIFIRISLISFRNEWKNWVGEKMVHLIKN